MQLPLFGSYFDVCVFFFSHQVRYFTCRIQSIDVSCINKLHQDWCPNVRYLGKIVFNFSIHLVMDDARETVKNLAAGTEVIICKSESGLFVITSKVWLHTYPCTSLFHLWVTARVWCCCYCKRYPAFVQNYDVTSPSGGLLFASQKVLITTPLKW